ncbi:MAG: hypothetical protein ACRDV0_06560, partial [Acidimicrobiales bacterium]
APVRAPGALGGVEGVPGRVSPMRGAGRVSPMRGVDGPLGGGGEALGVGSDMARAPWGRG